MATLIDCKNLRTARQKENNELVFRALISQEEVLVKHFCNNNELYCVLEEIDCSLQQLLYKCKVDYIYAKTLAGRISKVASRQSTKDEAYILDKSNKAVNNFGIQIENLNFKAYRPTRDGRICITTEQFDAQVKEQKLDAIKWRELQVCTIYKIVNLKFINTQYGEACILTLGD